MKRIRTLKPKPFAKPEQSKPAVKLSKADPDFFSKLGEVSAAKRALPVETFQEMARKSHPRRQK